MEADQIQLKANVDRLEKEKIALQQAVKQLELSILKPGVSSGKDVTRPMKDPPSIPNKETTRKVTPGRSIVPQSCRDLASLGHTLNGFYQVKSARNPKKMATLMCDFNNNDGTQSKIKMNSKLYIFKNI